MTPTRRMILGWGGGIAALCLLPPARAAAGLVEIAMAGRSDGSLVWFDPIGLRIEPGQTVRWTNRDRGNSHTATAYHPANAGHALRIPAAAQPWDSGYLLPDQSFSVTLTEPGVYDYYCRPHEHAGMVGRIIVGDPGTSAAVLAEDGVPEAALRAFPSVAAILAEGIVRPG